MRQRRSTAAAPGQFSKQLQYFRLVCSTQDGSRPNPGGGREGGGGGPTPQKCDEKNQEPETPEKKKEEGGCEVPASPDPYYPPIIYLPEVVVNSGEEEEEEAFRRRAKLCRLDLYPNISISFVVYQLSILSKAQLFCSRYAHEEEPAEWKERGTGEVELTYPHHNHFDFPRYPYHFVYFAYPLSTS